MGFSLVQLGSSILRGFLAVLVSLSLLNLSGLGELSWQSYAWATMLWERSPEMGLSEAVEDTFSGESPCPHCLAVAQSLQQKATEHEPFAPHQSESLRLNIPLLHWTSEANEQANRENPKLGKVNFAQAKTLATLWHEQAPVPPPRRGA